MKRTKNLILAFVTFCLLAASVVAGAGYVVRDQSEYWGYAFYMPLLPIGVTAVVFDLCRRGRSIPRLRFGLLVLGLVAASLQVSALLGYEEPPGVTLAARPASDGASTSQAPVTMRALHWNVRWGGGKETGEVNWGDMTATILDHEPDVVILSEAPSPDAVGRLAIELGEEWQFVMFFLADKRTEKYWYDMAVLSRWPLTKQVGEVIHDGSMMIATTQTPAGSLRIMVVDGEASPIIQRKYMLDIVADIYEEHAANGEPIHLIAGDFNAPGRAVGFDRWYRKYQLTGRYTWGWRGTYPAYCPLYDIDHIWLSKRIAILGHEYFWASGTDHRGQVVDFRFAGE